MKKSLNAELKQLRISSIRLESENKSIKMKNSMLEGVIKQDQEKSNSRVNPNDLAAFRILQEENQNLKALLKKHISESHQL